MGTGKDKRYFDREFKYVIRGTAIQVHLYITIIFYRFHHYLAGGDLRGRERRIGINEATLLRRPAEGRDNGAHQIWGAEAAKIVLP